MSESNETAAVPDTNRPHSALNRVLNLAIFFVGIGVYASAGLGLEQLAVFIPLQLTYFAVGVVIGVVGLLLWLVAR